MRVRLDRDQAERILEAIRNDHLCDICEYDSEGNVKPGTECMDVKLIKKFDRINSGSATFAGINGGVASKFKRRRDLSDAKIEGIKSQTEYMIKVNKKP